MRGGKPVQATEYQARDDECGSVGNMHSPGSEGHGGGDDK